MKLLAVLVVALVTLATGPSVQAFECAKPWQKVNDDICLLLNSGIKSWNHANFLCKFYESDLLYINNEAESKTLTNYLNNLIRYRFNQKSYLWLDAKKNTDTNKWYSTRNNQTIGFSNWGPFARPDESRSTLNCACFRLKDGTWKDCDCETTNHFVCRKSDKSKATTNSTLSSETKKTDTVLTPDTNVASSATIHKPVEKMTLPETAVGKVKELPNEVAEEAKQSGPAIPVGEASKNKADEVDVNVAKLPSEVGSEQAKIALPEVIETVKELVPERVDSIESSGPSRASELPPKLPAPVVISPVVQSAVLDSRVQAAERDEKLKPQAVEQVVSEILPIQAVENILMPPAGPMARMIGKISAESPEPSNRAVDLDAAIQSSATSSLESKPDVALKSNSLPTIDQVRDDIRPQIESEIGSSNTPNNPIIVLAAPVSEQDSVRRDEDTYLPLAEIDPQQFFNFASQQTRPLPTQPLLSIVDQDQVPPSTLDYVIGPPSVADAADSIGQLGQSSQVDPVSSLSSDLIQAAVPGQVDSTEMQATARPAVLRTQTSDMPRILLGSEASGGQNEIRMDGGALKLLRLLRPRNRFYRLKPEMLVEENPSLIRTLSGKVRPIEKATVKSPEPVSVQNLGKEVSASEANRNKAQPADLSPEDKSIIISSKVMIDEEEKKDKSQSAKRPETIRSENEKLISLLNEQTQSDPGKVMIRTSISKSTETFRLFECPNGYGFYSISNTNCNKYKRCDDWDLRNAILTINKCAEGKVFSFTKLNCVNQSEYECEDKVDKFVAFEENF